MPMSFPDFASLIDAAQVHRFRAPLEGESEETYRAALAAHVAPIDFVESEEIRNKVGWDKFDETQTLAMLGRKLGGSPASLWGRGLQDRPVATGVATVQKFRVDRKPRGER